MRLRWWRPSASRPAWLDRPRWAAPGAGSWCEGELLAFDLETTGTNRFADVPVSFALVHMRAGRVLERRNAIVDPGRPIPEEAVAIHGIGDDERERAEIGLAAAVETIAAALVDAGRRGTPVVGMKLDFDLTMVDTLCRSLGRRGLVERGWCGPVLDALTLDRRLDPDREGSRSLVALCGHYGVPIVRPHSAACDAEAAARVLLEMARRFDRLAWASPARLHLEQAASHREWATAYAERRRIRALGPLDESEWDWPLAAPRGPERGVA